MAITEHQSAFGDMPAPRPANGADGLRLEDELDRAEMDVMAGRMMEARAKFVAMDRALRETPRALVLRAKSSPHKDSHELIAALAKERLKRLPDTDTKLQLITALALCGDRQTVLQALPSSVGLNEAQNRSRTEIVELLGFDPEKAPDTRNWFQRKLDRWIGLDGA